MGQALVENISMKNKSVKLSTEENWLPLDEAAGKYLGTIQKNSMAYYKKTSEGKVGFITHDMERLKKHQQFLLEQKKLASLQKKEEKKSELLLPVPTQEKKSIVETTVDEVFERQVLNHLDVLSVRLSKIEKKLGVSA